MLRKNQRNSVIAAVLTVLAIASPCLADEPKPFTAVLHSAEQVTPKTLRDAKAAGHRAIVLELRGGSETQTKREIAAAERIQKAGFTLNYWIEVARNPAMADKHPEWLASIQGHQQWRRLFKDAPKPKKGEVVKVYPWVPILYREAFDAQLQRVEGLLKGKPAADSVYLNDLQGAPSACGCGNPLCRWTAHYGPIKTATPLGDDAAAKFLAAVRKAVPKTTVVPVWVTECEEHDGKEDGWCAGVGCFHGICWRAYSRQLMPVAKDARQIAVLTTYRELKREDPVFKQKAGWVKASLRTFQTMLPLRGGKAIPAGRLVAVVQGWKVTDEEIRAQQQRAREAGVAGIVISRIAIDQSWKPAIYKHGK